MLKLVERNLDEIAIDRAREFEISRHGYHGYHSRMATALTAVISR